MRHFNVFDLYVAIITTSSYFQKRNCLPLQNQNCVSRLFPKALLTDNHFILDQLAFFVEYSIFFESSQMSFSTFSVLWFSVEFKWPQDPLFLSNWYIDPGNLRLDFHVGNAAGPQERQRTWRGKKRVYCSSYWKVTEGQMETLKEEA